MAPAGGTEDEGSGEDPTLSRFFVGKERVDGGPGHVSDGLGNGGKSRNAVFGLFGSVEGSHRDILGNSDPGVMEGPEEVDGLEVGADKNGGGASQGFCSRAGTPVCVAR